MISALMYHTCTVVAYPYGTSPIASTSDPMTVPASNDNASMTGKGRYEVLVFDGVRVRITDSFKVRHATL